MSAKELYISLKKEYENYVVIIKEKHCYKTFFHDAKIMWYLFNYKYNSDIVIFGNNAFDKVVNELKEVSINFVIISKVEELLSYKSDNNSYLEYYELSEKAYSKILKEKELIKKLKVILSNKEGAYEKIDNFFNTFFSNN